MKNYKLLLTPLLALFISCGVNFKSLQKEENTHHFTTEEQLRNEKTSNAIETFYANGTEAVFTGKANVKIYYKSFVQPKRTSPAIFISSGRTEAALKYKEVIYDLYNNGYSVYIHDHRGQGLSGRMTEDPDMGYIDTFQFYIDDMKYFYDQMLAANSHHKKYLLSHSLGGAIGMTYLEQYPTDFDAAAFSSPMLGFTPGTCSAAKILVGKSPKYAVGQSAYEDDKLNFDRNKLTGSEIRYDRVNLAFNENPKAQLGGATYQWVYKSCLQFKYINSNINKIETPFILFSAENEKVVNPKAHQYFVENAQKLNKSCEAFTIKNANHELLIEKDEPRIETLNHILNFFPKE
jgi:lysophospholipase